MSILEKGARVRLRQPRCRRDNRLLKGPSRKLHASRAYMAPLTRVARSSLSWGAPAPPSSLRQQPSGRRQWSSVSSSYLSLLGARLSRRGIMVRRPASTSLLQAASAPHPVLDSRCTPVPARVPKHTGPHYKAQGGRVGPRKRGPCAPATAPLSTRQQTPKGPVPKTTRFACIHGPPHTGGTLLSLLGRSRSTELSTATAVGSPSVVLRELVVSLSFGGSFIA